MKTKQKQRDKNNEKQIRIRKHTETNEQLIHV